MLVRPGYAAFFGYMSMESLTVRALKFGSKQCLPIKHVRSFRRLRLSWEKRAHSTRVISSYEGSEYGMEMRDEHSATSCLFNTESTCQAPEQNSVLLLLSGIPGSGVLSQFRWWNKCSELSCLSPCMFLIL
jgi:hypothetical protein